jgi:hypothetical protein
MHTSDIRYHINYQYYQFAKVCSFFEQFNFYLVVCRMLFRLSSYALVACSLLCCDSIILVVALLT